MEKDMIVPPKADGVTAARIQSELSIERTKLANKRTFLAYLSAAVGLVVAGAGLMKFIRVYAWIAIGWVCIGLAPLVLIMGIVDYLRVKSLIRKEIAYLNTYL